jgi:hypothetical protein
MRLKYLYGQSQHIPVTLHNKVSSCERNPPPFHPEKTHPYSRYTLQSENQAVMMDYNYKEQ